MRNQYTMSDEMYRVLSALQVLCNGSCPKATLPVQAMWPKTRHIADYCDMNIYTTRRYLMKLVKSNKAYMSSCSINNSLRWYIVDPLLSP